MKTNMKAVYGVVTRNKKERWTAIGVAFVNRDSSINILFDYLPTSRETTIQLRDLKEPDKETEAPAEESASA
jgi:hypothetical protein